MGCFVRGGKNGRGYYVWDDKKQHGMLCPGVTKTPWDVLSRVANLCGNVLSGVSKNGMGCFVRLPCGLHFRGLNLGIHLRTHCYDIKPVRKEEGKSYWKIPLCDDDATREK